MHEAIRSRLASIRRECRRHGVARLELFGSATDPLAFDPESSDADFVVTFLPNAEQASLSQYLGLAEALKRVLGRAVDLVEAGAVKNPFVAAEINRTRALIYAA